MASSMSSSGMLSRPGERRPVVSERGLVPWGEVCWGDMGEAGCELNLTKGERGTGLSYLACSMCSL